MKAENQGPQAGGRGMPGPMLRRPIPGILTGTGQPVMSGAGAMPAPVETRVVPPERPDIPPIVPATMPPQQGAYAAPDPTAPTDIPDIVRPITAAAPQPAPPIMPTPPVTAAPKQGPFEASVRAFTDTIVPQATAAPVGQPNRVQVIPGGQAQPGVPTRPAIVPSAPAVAAPSQPSAPIALIKRILGMPDKPAAALPGQPTPAAPSAPGTGVAPTPPVVSATPVARPGVAGIPATGPAAAPGQPQPNLTPQATPVPSLAGGAVSTQPGRVSPVPQPAAPVPAPPLMPGGTVAGPPQGVAPAGRTPVAPTTQERVDIMPTRSGPGGGPLAPQPSVPGPRAPVGPAPTNALRAERPTTMPTASAPSTPQRTGQGPGAPSGAPATPAPAKPQSQLASAVRQAMDPMKVGPIMPTPSRPQPDVTPPAGAAPQKSAAQISADIGSEFAGAGKVELPDQPVSSPDKEYPAQPQKPAVSKYDKSLSAAEQKLGLPAGVLKAVAMHESRLNPNAKNTNKDGTNDAGIMQINSTHLKKGETDWRTDPDKAIAYGGKVFAAALRQAQSINKNDGAPTDKDITLAYQIYNGGPRGYNRPQARANAQKFAAQWAMVRGK